MGLKAEKTELHHLKNVFQQLDTDGDGHLSKEEFMAAEKKINGFRLGNKWDEVLANCDLDGDGKIDYQEFYTAAVNHQKIITKQNIQYAFNTFDTNGDGSIDIEEFKSALPTNHRKTLMESSSEQIGQGAQNLRNSTKQTTDNDDDSFVLLQKQSIKDNIKWESILREVDTNGDGLISFEEFSGAL